MSLKLNFTQYPVLPSVFQLAEVPLYLSNMISNFATNRLRNSDQHVALRWASLNRQATLLNRVTNYTAIACLYAEQFLLRSILPEQGLIDAHKRKQGATDIRCILQMPFGAVTMILTPFSLVADPIIGIVEALFAIHQGYSDHTWKLILHKKCIASPMQQLALLVIQVAIPVIISPFFINGSIKNNLTELLWIVGIGSFALSGFTYEVAQTIIGRGFPDWAKPEGFLIFINGGAEDADGHKFTEECESAYQDYKEQQGKSPQQSKWKEYVDSIKDSLSTEKGTDEFEGFKNNFKSGLTEKELLGITQLTEETLKTAYKKWSRVLHPDRRQGPGKDPEILFKVLGEARLRLEQSI